jgi:hypothetical protein
MGDHAERLPTPPGPFAAPVRTPKDLAQGTFARVLRKPPLPAPRRRRRRPAPGPAQHVLQPVAREGTPAPKLLPMPQEPEMLPDLKVASPESTSSQWSYVRRSPASPTTSHRTRGCRCGWTFLRRGRTRTSGLQRHYAQSTAPRPTRLPGSCSVVCRRELRRSSTTRSRGRSTGPAQDGVAPRHLLFRLPARLPAAKLRW